MLIFPSYSHHIPIEDLLTTSETARRTCHGGEPTWAPPSFRGLSMDGCFLRKSIGNTMVLSWNIVYRHLYIYILYIYYIYTIYILYIYTISILYIYRTLPYGSGKFSHHPIRLDGLLLKKTAAPPPLSAPEQRYMPGMFRMFDGGTTPHISHVSIQKRRNHQQPHVFERCGGFLTWGYPQIIHFIGCSTCNHPFWGPPFYETPMFLEMCPGQCHLHETSTPNLLASQAFPCPVLVADHAWHTGRFHKFAVQVDQTKQGLNVASKNWV